MNSQVRSIGLPKVLLHLSKTKDNVGHVGLSQQQDPLKVLAISQLVNYSLFLNNNLLTVPIHMETMDVMEG